MKRKYIKRKPSRSSIAHRIANIVGLDPKSVKLGYFDRRGLTDLLIAIEQYHNRIKDFEDAAGIAKQ